MTPCTCQSQTAKWSTEQSVWCVYTLEGPDHVARYVGIAEDPRKRVDDHYRGCGGKDLAAWLRTMRSSGSKVTMRIVERTEKMTRHDAIAVRKRWVATLAKQGAALLNAYHRPKPACPWPVVDETRSRKAKRARGSR